MAVLHTWGRTLCWHPHVHCVVPGLVVTAEGHVQRCPPTFLLPVRALSQVYRAVLLRKLRGHRDLPRLPLIPWSKQWVVYCRPCNEGPGNVLRYLARYTRRGPLPENSILNVSDQHIAFRYISHRTKRPSVCKLIPREFLRRYVQHALPPGFHRIRYYGILAPSARPVLRALRAALLEQLAALQPLIDELHQRCRLPAPSCPRCGSTSFVRTDFTSPNRRAPPWPHAA
jgi:hypothetical protein